MTKDLPDFQSEVVSAAVEATAFRSGLDADKPASPAAGDIWLARDTGYLYVCFTAGSWEKSPKNYLELTGGTLTGDLGIGAHRIKTTNLLVKQIDVNTLAVKTVADDAYRSLQLLNLYLGASIRFSLNGQSITAPDVDDNYLRFLARKSGVGLADVAKLQGGATPTFDLLYGRLIGALNANSQKITALAAPTASGEAARKDEVDVVDAKLDDVSWAEPARALDTIYQNGAKIRLVTVTVGNPANDILNSFSQMGSSTPPTTTVAVAFNYYSSPANYNQIPMTFIVPPDYYYRVSSSGGYAKLREWHEWDLH